MPPNSNDKNDWSARDKWNSFVVKALTPITVCALLTLMSLATFYVKTSFSDVKEQAKLVSQESKETAKKTAVLEEAVQTIKKDVAEIKEMNRDLSKDMKELIREQRRPR